MLLKKRKKKYETSEIINTMIHLSRDAEAIVK